MTALWLMDMWLAWLFNEKLELDARRVSKRRRLFGVLESCTLQVAYAYIDIVQSFTGDHLYTPHDST
jgi:hypothetical protein